MSDYQTLFFPESILEAKEIQSRLAKKVILQDDFISPPLKIGGMDVSCNRFDPSVYASIVVLDYVNFSILEKTGLKEIDSFPYRTGLLSFREAPPLIKAFKTLKNKPDLLLIDGQGISHPRGLGIASHIGILLDIPTIGVAKSLLIGKPEKNLNKEAGSQVSLIWKDREIGKVYRSKNNCNPLIISAGHRISLPTAVKIVEQCLQGYRLPEPTRQAHLAANEYRKSFF